jgi:hypothetical protein
MKWIKQFKQFKESLQIDLTFNSIDIMESLNIWQDILLKSISAEPVDIFDTLKLSGDLKSKLDLDTLSDLVEFLNSLSSIGLKKSPLQNTTDYQTFLNKPCKFMFIYDFNANELENPEYLAFQSWNDTLKKWDETKLFKVKDDVKKFYDKLTSKTIEIVDGSENYIYSTSNGNDWELQNIDKENDIYTKILRKEELQKILDESKITLNII